jgi:hypothetical protein
MTTIGYGNYVPVSVFGRGFTALYSVIGVLIYSYANFLLAVTLELKLHKLHQKHFPAPPKTTTLDDSCCQRFQRSAKHLLARAALIFAEIGVVWLWLLAMAAAYSHFEGWSFYEAFYFSFVTVNTIGYGDFAPSKTRDHPLNYVFIFGGLFLNSVLLSTLTRSKNGALGGEDDVSAEEEPAQGRGKWWQRRKAKRGTRHKGSIREVVEGVVEEVEEDIVIAETLLTRLCKCILAWFRGHSRMFWLLSALGTYTVIGGVIFRQLESEDASLSLSMLRSTLSDVADGSVRDELTGELLLGTAADAAGSALLMNELVSRLSQARNCPGADVAAGGGESPWTFVASCMFAAATYTSVGYGDISPETDGGKAMVMLYFFPGAWLFSMVSLEIAKGLHARIMTRIRHAARLGQRRRDRIRRRHEERQGAYVSGGAGGGAGGGSGSSSDEEEQHNVEAVEVEHGVEINLDLGSHRKHHTKKHHAKKHKNDDLEAQRPTSAKPKLQRKLSVSRKMSLTVDQTAKATRHAIMATFKKKHVVAFSAFSMTSSFLVLSGIFFSFLEPWNGSEGVWFAFITASTIGFGDFVPSYGGGPVWVLQSALMIVGVSLWGLFFQIMSAPDPDALKDARKGRRRSSLRRVETDGTGRLCKDALKEVNTNGSSRTSPLHTRRDVARVSLAKTAPAGEQTGVDRRGQWESRSKAKGPLVQEADRGPWERERPIETVKVNKKRVVV